MLSFLSGLQLHEDKKHINIDKRLSGKECKLHGNVSSIEAFSTVYFTLTLSNNRKATSYPQANYHGLYRFYSTWFLLSFPS